MCLAKPFYTNDGTPPSCKIITIVRQFLITKSIAERVKEGKLTRSGRVSP